MRRLRYCSRRYGGLKEPQALSEGETTDGASRNVSLGRSISLDTNHSATVKRSLTQRDSVAKMAWNGLSRLVKAGCTIPRLRPRVSAVGAKRAPSRSFIPAAFVAHKDDEAAEQTKAQSSEFEGPSSSACSPSPLSQPSNDQELKPAMKRLKDDRKTTIRTEVAAD